MFRSVIAVLMLAAGSTSLVAGEQEQTPPKELVQYVRDAKRAGENEFQIQQNAVNSGWPLLTVNEAILFVRDKDAGNQPTAPATGKPAPEDIKDAASPPAKPESASAGQDPLGTGVPTSAGQTAGPAPGVDAVKQAEGAKSPPDAATTKPATTDRGVPDDYQIGAGDVLEINVWKEPDASVRSVVVRPDGRISMPLLKEVEVVGLTPIQLERLITERLESIINSPDVTIVVTGINSKKVYVQGKVKKEGPIPYTYRMTVMQALSEAGGLTDYAKKKAIYILRTENGKEFKLPFDYAAVLKGQRMELNIQLVSGDMIVVP
jgi:polysaccharide export outer membrane protein